MLKQFRHLMPILGVLLGAHAQAAEPASARTTTNLLSNGSFEKPVQWGRDWTTPQKEFIKVEGNASHGSKCIHMTIPAAQAAREGVVFRSEFVPCERGGRYHLKCDLKGTGSTVIVFVEAYDPQYIKEGRPQGDYRSQCVRGAPSREWKTYEDTFQIRRSPKSTATIGQMQVKVFAYYPEGEVWVDNVVLEPAPAETAEPPKP